MPNAEFNSDVIRCMTEDANGDLWIGVGKRLYRVNFKGGVVTPYSETVKMPGHFVKSISRDDKGMMWFGSDAGIATFQEGNWNYYSILNGLDHNLIYSIHSDSIGNAWIGTFNGLDRMTDGKFYPELNNTEETFDTVNAICEDQEGNIWVGSKNGLYEVQARRARFYTRKQGLSINKVNSVLEDHKGVLWIATRGGGLNQLKDDKFTTYSSTNLIKANNLEALHEARNGDLWFGTTYGQLYHLSDGKFEESGGNNVNITNAIRIILQDSKTNLWLGTSRGLIRVNPGFSLSDRKQFTQFNSKNGLAGDNVRAILEDHEGNLWVGTQSGLSCWKDGKFTNLTTAQGLSGDSIFGLYEDKEESLWIATGDGLNRLRKGKFTSYTTKQGLWDDDVEEIVEDDLGNLWIRCSKGVFSVRKKKLDDLDRGTVSSVSCFSLGKEEGIMGFQKEVTAKPSGWKSADGKIWFPGVRGLAVIDPLFNLKKNEKVPPIFIEDVFVDKKKMRSTTSEKGFSVHVPPNHGELEIRYTALSLQAPEKNRFRYMLEGVDSEWSDAGTRRVAYYNHISPGHYRFHVVGCNNDGVWNEQGASLDIYLDPHFYQTAWFYLGCILLGGMIIAGIYRFNMQRLKHHQKVLESLVEDRTRHLKEETLERQRVQTQLIEVSRQAGMAEVASGVLHNVGNVLNSVNVSATLVSDSLRNSKLSNLRKVSAMIQEHADDPVHFFTNDEKGKQLPGYIPKLTEHLLEEQTHVIAELNSICKNVDHIKDIVAMQQSYAKVSGVTEMVVLSDLIDDALRMNAAALARHDVKVIRDYAHQTPICTQKHKVLQILVNFIRNAKYACDEGGLPDKLMKLSTAMKSPNHVTISVVDNGIGIPAENLTRIFSHGFTTRKEGHGFGLHSAALSARELGGSLVVQSDGPGCGATFILELPLQPPPATV
ncbi:MAG: two-component regulator propeller domain-containing protein [Verrucomicrobiota bacterium]